MKSYPTRQTINDKIEAKYLAEGWKFYSRVSGTNSMAKNSNCVAAIASSKIDAAEWLIVPGARQRHRSEGYTNSIFYKLA